MTGTTMKPSYPFLAVFLVGIVGAVAVPGQAAVVRGETVTAAETATMPPLCKLIVVDKPNAHIDRYAQQKNAALFDRPEYRMAKNAYHVHHWCRAVISRMRYYAARSEQQRRAYMGDFYDEMDYVIRNTDPAWPYMPMMHAEKGEMYLVDKKLPEAMNQALSAIKLNPAFTRGYVLLVNTYIAMGQKDKALEAATEGIRHNPASNALKKMYDELGGTKPYPSEPVATPAKPAPEPAAKAEEPEASAQLPPPSAGELKSADEEAAVPQPLRRPGDAASPLPEPAAPEPPGPKKYCRFCP
ncbi:MAG: tetratricopeptide repeat protein [Methylophilaceae bacterium]